MLAKYADPKLREQEKSVQDANILYLLMYGC